MSGVVSSYFQDDASEFSLSIWDLITGSKLGAFASPSKKTNLLFHRPTGMEFSPDGTWIAVNHLKHVEIWDVAEIRGSSG